MLEEKEQRLFIEFCGKLWKNRTENFEMLETNFGGEFLSRALTYDWFKRFKEG
jgi:hypothetical protein